MASVADGVPRRIANCKANSFTVELDTTALGEFSGTGIVEQASTVCEHESCLTSLCLHPTAAGEGA
jgi:hypothetical protein